MRILLVGFGKPQNSPHALKIFSDVCAGIVLHEFSFCWLQNYFVALGTRFIEFNLKKRIFAKKVQEMKFTCFKRSNWEWKDWKWSGLIFLLLWCLFAYRWFSPYEESIIYHINFALFLLFIERQDQYVWINNWLFLLGKLCCHSFMLSLILIGKINRQMLIKNWIIFEQ